MAYYTPTPGSPLTGEGSDVLDMFFFISGTGWNVQRVGIFQFKKFAYQDTAGYLNRLFGPSLRLQGPSPRDEEVASGMRSRAISLDCGLFEGYLRPPEHFWNVRGTFVL